MYPLQAIISPHVAVMLNQRNHNAEAFRPELASAFIHPPRQHQTRAPDHPKALTTSSEVAEIRTSHHPVLTLGGQMRL